MNNTSNNLLNKYQKKYGKYPVGLIFIGKFHSSLKKNKSYKPRLISIEKLNTNHFQCYLFYKPILII